MVVEGPLVRMALEGTEIGFVDAGVERLLVGDLRQVLAGRAERVGDGVLGEVSGVGKILLGDRAFEAFLRALPGDL